MMNKSHINLKLEFHNNLAHTVHATLPLNLAVSSKPDLFTMKKIQDVCNREQTVPGNKGS